jgi:alkanesulfonate monooxygenase
MVAVYTTLPAVRQSTPSEFHDRLALEAKWAEAAGVRGMLVYSDNTLLDPWAVAQFLIERTEKLVPLVAVNPVYMHPFSAARMISTLGFFQGRRVDLNYVIGGFARHLTQLGCALDHDERYGRLAEYAEIVDSLLTKTTPTTYTGEYYALKGAMLVPSFERELAPRVFVSGTSPACGEVRRRLSATRLMYPHEISTYEGDRPLAETGIRLGIIARDTAEEAWREAHSRFPVDRDGEELLELAAETVESTWYRKLSADAIESHAPKGVYWLYPFRAYRTFCPYLVGTYADVSELLGRYLSLGADTVILDDLREEDDIHHAQLALRLAGAESD